MVLEGPGAARAKYCQFATQRQQPAQDGKERQRGEAYEEDFHKHLHG